MTENFFTGTLSLNKTKNKLCYGPIWLMEEAEVRLLIDVSNPDKTVHVFRIFLMLKFSNLSHQMLKQIIIIVISVSEPVFLYRGLGFLTSLSRRCPLHSERF